MSAAATAPTTPDQSVKTSDRGWGRTFQLAIIGLDVGLLAVALIVDHGALRGNWSVLVTWGVLIAVAGSFTVPAGEARLGLDLPLLLGAGLVFGPIVAGLLGFFAVFDAREFTRDVSPLRSIFNRAQISLSAMAGTAVFRATGVSLGVWPWTALAGLLALLADAAVNYGLVALYWMAKSRRSFLELASGMRFGRAESFVPIYACFGFLGVLVAECYVRLGIGGVALFVAPVLLARQAFSHRRLLDDATRSLQLRERALRRVDDQVANERLEERMVLAGDLHDEVLPLLFQVHLMGQVLRQDVASGRLLDLDSDLPSLLTATDAAQVAIRDVVRGLRLSPLDAGGLSPTLRSLARRLENSGSPRIELDLQSVAGTEDSQRLAFRVAREALVNASRYSRATIIHVRLYASEKDLNVAVTDDGIGFDPTAIDQADHFGLQLIAERIAGAGGSVMVDSRLGGGTVIAARVPADLKE
jgi:signal transduction histidine kinase